jgi:2-methylcitrate dehydratase PrpD
MTSEPNNAQKHLTDHAIRFILETQWPDLPPVVQHQARRCLLDTLGALLAGAQTPVAQLTADFAVTQCGGNEATILVDGRSASAVGAALANGMAANALDIDDGYRRIKGHPGACVLPALLAAAQRRGTAVSGPTFLTTLVVGYEIGIRAGLIRHALYQTYHSSGSWGALAAAATAGKILGLTAVQLRQALGTAEYHAPIAPMMKGIDTPAMSKDSVGWGAMVGLASVLLAQQGFTGVEPLLSDAPEPAWVLDLGQAYEILNLYFKPYACCRWTQPAIAGALQIAQEHHLTPDDIARIEVRTFRAAAQLSRAHPRNTEEAQYNLAYPVAAALIDGQLGPQQVLPPRIYDGELLALADRVTVTVSEDYEVAFPARALADVIVTTKNGRLLTALNNQAAWEPPDSLPGDEELTQKFQRLVTPVLGTIQTEKLAAAIWQFDHINDIGPILEKGKA